MSIPSLIAKYFKDPQHDALVEQNRLLKRIAIQASTDITTNTDSTVDRSYVGTPSQFSTYSKQVTEVGRMYDNIADWGCMIAKNVIDMRTAFSVGKGIRVIKHKNFKGDAIKELDWVKAFMRVNNLDEEMPQEYAKEAEIEGKVLLRFLVDPTTSTVRVVHVPWRKFNYSIITPDYDFFDYMQAKYDGSGGDTSFDLTAPFFVYKRFGGVADAVNKTPSKIAFVMREMRDLDKALWDWRKINRLFAAPTPVITCPDKQTAKDMQAQIDGGNWRIGELLVIGGEAVRFELIGWKGDGFTTLKAETEGYVKTISGTTGIPVHFLGYPELLSNRDTAENLIELIVLSTLKERNTWKGAYEELFQKAIMISNTFLGTTLNPEAVDAVIDKPDLTTVTGANNASVPKSNNTGNEPSGTE